MKLARRKNEMEINDIIYLGSQSLKQFMQILNAKHFDENFKYFI